MSANVADLIAAVVLLAATVTVLLPRRFRRDHPPERVSPRTAARYRDDEAER